MEQPTSVKTAIIAAITALIVGFINTALLWSETVSKLGADKTILTIAIPTVIYLTLLYFVSSRHKWARIILIILLVISIPGYVVTLFLPVPLLSIIIQATQLILNLTCIIFLFAKPSREWFSNE